MDIIYQLGKYGPVLLIILSWYLLWGHKNMFFYYTIGVFANSVLNIIMKGIIQEPRPMFDIKKIAIAKTHGKRYFFQNGVPFDIFGMPSGHAQTALFSTVFVYLTLKHTNFLYFYLLISLLICYQRVDNNYHTIMQVIIGAITGSVFAYLMYQLSRGKIKGIIRERLDDFGPV